VQCAVIPISEKVIGYAERTTKALREAGIRVSIDTRNERLQKKIRDAEVEKIPYMVIVGEKEEDQNTLSIRSKAQGDVGKTTITDFLAALKREIEEKVR
jgi:threonyl-tRNA synthetase